MSGVELETPLYGMRGQDDTIEGTVVSAEGAAIDLTGIVQLTFTLAGRYGGLPLVTRTLGTGITGQVDGTYAIDLSHAVKLAAGLRQGIYWYTLLLIDGTGRRDVVARGPFHHEGSAA